MNYTDNKCFVDTNILVYAYDIKAGEKRVKAKTIVESLWKNENGVLSIQVIQELFVILTQKIANPLPRHSAQKIIEDYSSWHVVSPSTSDVISAIKLHKEHGLNFWDAMIVRAAISAECPHLISEDMQHGQNFGPTRVINPFLQTRLDTPP